MKGHRCRCQKEVHLSISVLECYHLTPAMRTQRMVLLLLSADTQADTKNSLAVALCPVLLTLWLAIDLNVKEHLHANPTKAGEGGRKCARHRVEVISRCSCCCRLSAVPSACLVSDLCLLLLCSLHMHGGDANGKHQRRDHHRAPHVAAYVTLLSSKIRRNDRKCTRLAYTPDQVMRCPDDSSGSLQLQASTCSARRLVQCVRQIRGRL